MVLLDIRNLLRCLANVFLRDGGSQIYRFGRCRHWPGPHLDESRPDLAEGGLVRAELEPFRPHFYNAWMAQKNAKNVARDVAAVSDLYEFVVHVLPLVLISNGIIFVAYFLSFSE